MQVDNKADIEGSYGSEDHEYIYHVIDTMEGLPEADRALTNYIVHAWYRACCARPDATTTLPLAAYASDGGSNPSRLALHQTIYFLIGI